MSDCHRQLHPPQARPLSLLILLVCLAGGCGEERKESPRTTGTDPFAWVCRYEHLNDLETGKVADFLVTGKEEVLVLVGDEARIVGYDGSRRAAWQCAFPGRAVTAAAGRGFWIAGSDRVGCWDRQGRVLVPAWSLRTPDKGRRPLITSLARVESNLLLADAANRCVHRYAVNGDFINLIGEDATPRGLVIPSPYFPVCAGPDETLWLGHTGRHRVCRYRLDGTLLSSWGRQGMEPGSFAGCCNPVGLFPLADGRMLTAEKGLGRITMYGAHGRPLSLVGPGMIDRKSRNLRVAMDAAGRVLVSDPAAGRIRIFRSTMK